MCRVNSLLLSTDEASFVAALLSHIEAGQTISEEEALQLHEIWKNVQARQLAE